MPKKRKRMSERIMFESTHYYLDRSYASKKDARDRAAKFRKKYKGNRARVVKGKDRTGFTKYYVYTGYKR